MENGIPKPENSGVQAVAPDATEGSVAPVAPVEEIKAASMLVVLAKNASGVRSTVNFLERRGFAAKVVPSLNEAVELFTKKEANMLLLSVNFPHPKVEMLPILMNQSFKIETIVFAEETDRKSSNKLNNARTKHVLFGPVSGPVVMMKIRQIDREMSGEADADVAASEKRSHGAKEDQGDIKVGGKRGSNDDTVVLNGKASGAGGESKSFDNLMKSLDDDSELSASEGLSRSGDTYVAKGERSKMKSAGGDGSADSDEGALISQDAQDLRAALDRGLEAAPPGKKSRLIMPRKRASMPRPELPSSPEESRSYEQAAAAMRAAEHERAVEAARERKEKQDAASASKTEREALAAKQKAEREENLAKMKSEREASGAKTKAEREVQASEKKAAREIEHAEKKAAVVEAVMDRAFESRAESAIAAAEVAAPEAAADETANADVESLAARAKDELGVSIDEALEAALFGGTELEKANNAKAQSAIAAAKVVAPEAHAAAAAEKAAREKSEAAEKVAKEKSAEAKANNAGEPAAGATASDASPLRELSEAEKAALSPEDKVQRCLREALAIVAGAPKDSILDIAENATAALITLRSSQMHCAFVVSMNYAKQTANELFHRMEIAFFSLLRDHGVEFENQDTFSILLDNLGIVKDAFKESEFAVVTQNADIAIGAARVFVGDPHAKVEPYEDDMHTINLRDVPLNVPVTFSLFLHLKQNQKFIRYLKKGSSIAENQLARLEEHKAQGLIEKQEIEAYKRHFAAHAIQAPKKRAS